MKILLVLPLLGLGGGQRYVTIMANYWTEIGHDVTIISLRETETFYSISDKVTVIKLNYDYSRTLGKVYSGFITMLKLRNKAKQIQPDFVLSILSTTNILTILATSFLGIKVFVRDAMSPFRKRTKTDKFLRRVLYKKATGVITMTRTAKEIVVKETGVKSIKIIHNPVKEILINEKIKKEKIILNVGRLHQAKGQRYLLEVCARLNEPEWKFVILGEGPLRRELEKRIVELGIENQVVLPGAIKDIDEWLSKASIFAFPSITEGWGNSLSEAMTAGLPCVSFDCEVGPRDMINDKINGYLVPVGNVEFFTSRIKTLINDLSIRNKISLEAKKTSDKYKIENISKEILDFCTID